MFYTFLSIILSISSILIIFETIDIQFIILIFLSLTTIIFVYFCIILYSLIYHFKHHIEELSIVDQNLNNPKTSEENTWTTDVSIDIEEPCLELDDDNNIDEKFKDVENYSTNL